MIHWNVDRTELDPEFADDIRVLFAEDPDGWTITQGKRSRSAQQALYDHFLEGGPLAAPPGHSAHEWGLAIDFAQIVNGVLSWNAETEGWKRIEATVNAHPRLHGGWKFPPDAPADPDHIQAVKWYAKRAELKAAGEW